MKKLVLTIVLISLLGFIYIMIQQNEKIKVILNKNLKAEINSEVKISNFIDKVEKGKIVSADEIIDTTKLGNKKIVIKIENKKKVIEYNFNIEIVDTTLPVITAKKEFSLFVGNEIDLLEGASVIDNSNEDLKVTIEGDYDFNKAGTYNLNYVAQDKSGNKAIKQFVLNVKTDQNNRVVTTSKGYTLKVSNGIAYVDGILIANKTYSLPSNYGTGLTKKTVDSFNIMKADAASIGLNLYNSSGFRSYYDQKYIYENYVKRDGKAEADRYSARAGHSEHQTGLAFDLNTISSSFENTNEGKWVNDNCYKYGFIIRYPKGKESITGYMYEPWHLRYVGTDLATKLYNNGSWITLEEYFGIDSKY